MTEPSDEPYLGGGLYRAQVVDAYRGRPRGAAGPGFEPDRMRPRWRWAIVSVGLVAVLVLVGLIVRVPAGPAATVVGINGRLVVLALPGAELPPIGEYVDVQVAPERVLRGRVKDVQAAGQATLVAMALVELERAPAADELRVNSQVRLRAGTVPLLIDIVAGGE